MKDSTAFEGKERRKDGYDKQRGSVQTRSKGRRKPNGVI